MMKIQVSKSYVASKVKYTKCKIGTGYWSKVKSSKYNHSGYGRTPDNALDNLIENIVAAIKVAGYKVEVIA